MHVCMYVCIYIYIYIYIIYTHNHIYIYIYILFIYLFVYLFVGEGAPYRSVGGPVGEATHKLLYAACSLGAVLWYSILCYLAYVA